MRTMIAVAVLALVSPQAFAQVDNRYEKIYDKCLNESGALNNQIVFSCAEEAESAAKKDINRAYDAIYKQFMELDPSGTQAGLLESAQKAWIVYRDEQCRYEGGVQGEPMYGICPMRFASERAIELLEEANLK